MFPVSWLYVTGVQVLPLGFLPAGLSKKLSITDSDFSFGGLLPLVSNGFVFCSTGSRGIATCV